MRISDWSSDVCSSDLNGHQRNLRIREWRTPFALAASVSMLVAGRGKPKQIRHPLRFSGGFTVRAASGITTRKIRHARLLSARANPILRLSGEALEYRDYPGRAGTAPIAFIYVLLGGR